MKTNYEIFYVESEKLWYLDKTMFQYIEFEPFNCLTSDSDYINYHNYDFRTILN